jgi:hypothetical protein
MAVTKIIPIYGFGWDKGGQPIGVPEPFNVNYEVYEKANEKNFYECIIGTVSEPHHMFDGYWILVTPRTQGTFNVFVYDEKPPFYRDKNVNLFSVPSSASGFAMLDSDTAPLCTVRPRK